MCLRRVTIFLSFWFVPGSYSSLTQTEADIFKRTCCKLRPMFDSGYEIDPDYTFSAADYVFVRKIGDNVDIWRHKATKREYFFFHFSEMGFDEFHKKIQRMLELWHPSIMNISGIDETQCILKADIPENGCLDKISMLTHEQVATIAVGVCAGTDFLDYMNVGVEKVTEDKIYLNKSYEVKLMIINDVMRGSGDSVPFDSFVQSFSEFYEGVLKKCQTCGNCSEFLQKCRNGDFETSDEMFMWLRDAIHQSFKDKHVQIYETWLSKLRKFNARACFLCGKLLFHGEGFERDVWQAELCLKAAAEHGSERASKQLTRMRLRIETEIAFEVQKRLVDLSVKTFSETVKYFTELLARYQSCVARNIVGFARRSWAKVNLLVQLVIRIVSASSDFRDEIMFQIFENTDCFSIDLMYRLYTKKCLDIRDIVERIEEINIEDAVLFLPLFGELIRQYNSVLYERLVIAREEEEEDTNEDSDPKKLKVIEAIRTFCSIPELDTVDPSMTICTDKRDPLTLLKKDLTILEYAALWGNERCFKSMLQRMPTVPRMTVACAVTGGSLPIIQMLRDRGCSFNGTCHIAVKYFRHSVLEWLLDNHLDEYAPVLEFLAAEQNNVIFFIDYSFDPKRKDREGNTILHVAAQFGSIDVAKILAHKIDWRTPNNDGYGAYDYAEDWPELAEFFASIDDEEETEAELESSLASYGQFSNRYKPSGGFDDDDSSSSDSDDDDDIEAIRQKRLSARKSLELYLMKIIPEQTYKAFKAGDQVSLENPGENDKPEWITQEYDALIRDVVGEIAAERQYLGDTYSQYIERFVNMLYNGNHDFTATFPENVRVSDERGAQVSVVVELSDEILRKELRECLGLSA